MSGTSKSDASLQHDLISAPVQLVSSGREQFPVSVERLGRRRALLRGEGLPDAQPREGEFHGGHRGAESVGGGAFELGCWVDGGLGWWWVALWVGWLCAGRCRGM